MTTIAYHYLRFSTAAQGKVGRFSTQRQDDEARACCKEQGWELSPMTLQGLGVSAFTGKHRKKGGLKIFLDALGEGKIRKGSVLIVESFDRLSREHPGDALQLFLTVTNAGVDIFVTNLNQLFGRSKPDNYPLASQEFNRANRESKRKSELAIFNWQAKFKSTGKVITKRLPCWIVEQDGKLVLDHAKAKIIRKLFELSVGGLGSFAIARKLNKEGVECITGHSAWLQSSVNRLLCNKQVIGEFTPSSAKAIPHYFPPCIPESLFYQAQEAKKARKNFQGRPVAGDKVYLFAGLIHQGEAIEGSTRQAKGEKYYVKDIQGTAYMMRMSNRLEGADHLTVQYQPFENMLLEKLREVEVPAIEDDSGVSVAKLVELEENLAKLKARIRKTFSDTLASLVEDLESEKAVLLAEIKKPAPQGLRELRKLDLTNLEDRKALRQAIRSTVAEIIIQVDGKRQGWYRDVSCLVRFSFGMERSYHLKVGKVNRIIAGEARPLNSGEEY